MKFWLQSIFFLFLMGIFVVISTSAQNSCLPCRPRVIIDASVIQDLKSQRVSEVEAISVKFNTQTTKLFSVYQRRNYPNEFAVMSPLEYPNEIIWDFPIDKPSTISLSNSWLQITSHPFQPIIALGSEKGTLEIWNLETASSALNFHVGDFPIIDIAFHPNGELLAIANETKIAVVHLDSASLQQLSLNGEVVSVSNLSFSADGKWLASTADSSIVIWDTDTFNATTIDLEDGILQQVLFLPQSNDQLVTISSQSVHIWRIHETDYSLVATLEIPALPENSQLTSATLNADGSVLIAIYDQQEVVVWDTTTGEQINIPALSVLQNEDDPRPVYDVAFSPDGYWLVFGTGYGLVFFVVP